MWSQHFFGFEIFTYNIYLCLHICTFFCAYKPTFYSMGAQPHSQYTTVIEIRAVVDFGLDVHLASLIPSRSQVENFFQTFQAGFNLDSSSILMKFWVALEFAS